uniref:SHSP domain-containing protein n=1 Tax=Strongyloides venezuelensis TaxID=75913 RepID=A0A0K0G5A4_STRVS
MVNFPLSQIFGPMIIPKFLNILLNQGKFYQAHRDVLNSDIIQQRIVEDTTPKHNEDKEKEKIKEVHNHVGKEDGRCAIRSQFFKIKTFGNHLEVKNEDDKLKDVIIVLPKKHVRISTPDNNGQ